MKTEEFQFASNTGVCEIFGKIYTPNENVKAVVVLHHGMAEHQERYLDFIRYLTDNSVAVFMHDMANHKMSNQDKSITGYFGEKDGYKALVLDLKTVFDKAKGMYPDTPIIMMGHSMGSFITRLFTAWYSDAGFKGAIYMGTGGSNPVAGMGDMLSKFVAKVKGSKYKSKTLDKITFGTYNDKFEKRTSFDWLTRDTKIVDEYIADEYCGFLFSVKGMNDLIRLNIEANTQEWYNKLSKDLKILLISGDMDPVGNYSKGINEIAQKLSESGHNDVRVKLYEGGRHEILNETNRGEVYADVLDFINYVAESK